MEEDMPSFNLRFRELSPVESAFAMKHFNSALMEQQERVRRLENPDSKEPRQIIHRGWYHA